MKNVSGKRATAALLAVCMVLGGMPAGTVHAANAGDGLPEPSARELKNMALSRSAAAQGMVLLENKNQTLPIAGKGKVALYGYGAYKTMKGGTGSGNTNPRHEVNVWDGFLNAGYRISTTAYLEACRKKYQDAEAVAESWETVHFPDEVLTDEEIAAGKAGGTDTAVYVISRLSGEDGDRPAEDYELTENEMANIRKMAENFEHSIVLLNVGGIINATFAREIEQLDSVLLMSQAGMEGGNAVVDVLNGTVTPSGKLTDTWALKYSDYPASATFSDADHEQFEEFKEGIYVGYRYFDTFGKDVAYEFGYGQSYTDFDIRVDGVKADADTVDVTVTVRNTGETYAGREVVQIYFSAPDGTLEKTYQELAAYAKTDVLKPGESQQMTICYATSEMSSYDESKAAYVMDAGDYIIRVGNSSRNTKAAAVLKLDGLALTEQLSTQLSGGDFKDLKKEDATPITYEGEAEEIAAAPVITLSAAELALKDGNHASAYDDESVVTYVPEGADTSVLPSGPKWKQEIVEVPVDKKAKLIDVYKNKISMESFVAGLSNDQLCEIVDGDEVSTITDGAVAETTGLYRTNKGIPNIALADGPAGVRITRDVVYYEDVTADTVYDPNQTYYNRYLQGGKYVYFAADVTDEASFKAAYDKAVSENRKFCVRTDQVDYQFCTAWPIATLLAQTWDVDLVEEISRAVAEEMEEFDISLWLAPALNIHRDPRGGRNFEYYSEDPFISGTMAAAVTKGVESIPGAGVTLKHMAANNQEWGRTLQTNSLTERTLREIYLKGFEIAVKSAQPMAIMTSYNGINQGWGEPTAFCYDLCTDIVRGEWDFKGVIMTDWDVRGDKTKMMHPGNDMNMPGSQAEDFKKALEVVLPEFGPDGYPTEGNWGIYSTKKGKAELTAEVKAGTALNEAITTTLADGRAVVTVKETGEALADLADTSKDRIVTYHITRKANKMYLGDVQKNVIRILNMLMDTARFAELEKSVRLKPHASKYADSLKTYFSAQKAAVDDSQAGDSELSAAKAALKKTLSAAAPIADGGKVNYLEDTWEAFSTAYEAAKQAQNSINITKLQKLTADLAAAQAGLKTETLACGYKINMNNLPKVHFSEHPEWEEVYDAAWNVHKNNIQKIPAATNPEEPYYVDEAFRENIFVWDTMLMMLFDRFGINEFPTLSSIDNFYYHQMDGGDNDGYICREIVEETGANCWDPDTQKNTGTNPPLFAMAEWEQYQIHGDVSRFSKEINGKTIFERLVSHYYYIERTKKLANGLYGKTNGYGNGLDNTPNQDGQRLSLSDSDGRQTYNDLSIQQAQAAWYLSLIADAMGNKEQAEYFASENERIADLINEKLWSPNAHMYSNLSENGKSFTNISTPTNLWALAGHVATEERAQEIIKYHGKNSMKLYRPNGLATLAYDWDGFTGPFRPYGQYWMGSIWAPTSYQYVYGLREYGYDQLAFEEAVRHVNMVADVYEEGKKGSYIKQSTFWENYSSDYVRDGSESKPNFVGWTGSFAIGMVLEDLAGIDIDAPNNKVTWNVQLCEEFGVDNLYMKHDGKENRVSLQAEKRLSDLSDLHFTATVTEPVTLVVKAGGREESFDLTPGTDSYIVKGMADKTARVGYIGTRTRLLSEAADEATKEYYDENAIDYVYFQKTEDADVYDGIKYQTGKKGGKLYNVNTVGMPVKQNFEQWAAVNDSPSMQALGFADAACMTKGTYWYWSDASDGWTYGDEGFMFMAPASNKLKTIRLVVGIQNGLGKLKIALNDASDDRLEVFLKGGSKETEYVIDIPFCAASNDSDLFVQWLMDTAKSDPRVKVSIKSIALLDGGVCTPDVPENVTLQKEGDGTLTVSADVPENANYDSWSVKVYDAVDDTVVKEVPAKKMPYAIKDLPYGKYYVSVSGIYCGITSDGGYSETVLAEPADAADEARAAADLAKTLDVIYNGNTQENTINNFVLTTGGLLYGSRFTMSSSTDGTGYGVQNDGTVLRPAGNKDVESKITVTAALGGVTAQHEATVTVKAITEESGFVIGTGTKAYTGKEVDFTADGIVDWYQFNNQTRRHDSGRQSHKKGGSGINFYGINVDPTPGVDFGTYQDGSITFKYDKADVERDEPENNIGSRMEGADNYWSMGLDYSEESRHIDIYTGVWTGTGRIEFIVNGTTVVTEPYGAEGTGIYCVGFDYRLENPEDVAEVRVCLDKAQGKPVASLHAAVLTEQPADVAVMRQELWNIRQKGANISGSNNQKEDGTPIYTAESFSAFKAALSAAEAKVEAGTEQLTAEEVKAAVTEFEDAIALLVTVERKAAEDLANEALAGRKTANEGYTEESWEAYQALITELEAKLADPQTAPEELIRLANQVKEYEFKDTPKPDVPSDEALLEQIRKLEEKLEKAVETAGASETNAKKSQQEAEAAKRDAEDAKVKAQEAETDAKKRAEAAEEAELAAKRAQADAEIAKRNAESAQTATDGAKAEAQAAQQRAEAAKSAANAAKSEAEAAKTGAEAAQSLAEAAELRADAARSKAQAAEEAANAARTAASAAQTAAEAAREAAKAQAADADIARKKAEAAREAAIAAQTRAEEAEKRSSQKASEADEAMANAKRAQQAASDAQGKAEAARESAEIARKSAEDAQMKAEAVMEAARKSQAEIKELLAKAEEAQRAAAAEAEKAKAEVEKAKLEVEKAKLEAERAKVEAEIAKAETERAKEQAKEQAQKAIEAAETAQKSLAEYRAGQNVPAEKAKTVLQVKKTKISLQKGKSKKLQVKVKNADGKKITYKSGNKKVAKVSSSGKITGVRKGNTTITVKCNGISRKVKVTVK